jgi:hypothetical protein
MSSIINVLHEKAVMPESPPSERMKGHQSSDNAIFKHHKPNPHSFLCKLSSEAATVKFDSRHSKSSARDLEAARENSDDFLTTIKLRTNTTPSS